MKAYFAIRVFIMEDKNGEWWEYVNVRGNTSNSPAHSEENRRRKEFKTLEAAKRFATRKNYTRYEVRYVMPPVPPSIEWQETVVFAHN